MGVRNSKDKKDGNFMQRSGPCSARKQGNKEKGKAIFLKKEGAIFVGFKGKKMRVKWERKKQFHMISILVLATKYYTTRHSG